MRKFIQGVLKMTTKPFHVRVKVSGNQSVKINMESKNEPMSMVAENFKKPLTFIKCVRRNCPEELFEKNAE
jgi:hypothetical protein